MPSRVCLPAVLVLLAIVAAGCTSATSREPTIIFPTEIPTAAPTEEATPRVVGACTLITAAGVEEATGVAAEQVSASPLSCGYRAGETTVVLTLERAEAFDDFADSFATQGAGQPIDGVGDKAIYFPASLGGLLMASAGRSTYLLSGLGDADAARTLMQRVLQRHADQVAD